MLVHELLDRAAATWGSGVAISTSRGAVSYAELARRSTALAVWLDGQGVRRGDRVVLAVEPSPELAALLYACCRLGAVFVVVGPETPAAMMEFLLADCEPVLLVSDDDHRAVATARAIPGHDVRAATAVWDRRVDWLPRAVLPVDPVCLIYTSGSTAEPKAVVSDHGQVVFAANAIQRRLGYEPADRVLGALPMSFDYGLYQLFLCALSGARLHLDVRPPTGNELALVLAEQHITVLPAVPLLAYLLAALLRRGSPERRAERAATLAHLRLLTSTGAAMPGSVLEDLREHLPRLRIQLMYGLTECKRVSVMEPDGDLARPGSSGRALDGTEAYAVDEAGRRLPPGTPGELVIRGPHLMLGYWGAPELSARRFRTGRDLVRELHTGDRGFISADGYVYCQGRLDDVYKQHGTRVSVTEVEAAAHRVAGVHAAAVILPGDPLTGAMLVVVADAEPAEVLDRLRALLPAGKIPSSCLIVDELPRGERGKLDRARLARMVTVR